MAQTEDTELRDLVIEALEKNGSLAKIRALLRANIFLAFEDECENMRQNVFLDNILKLPEGILSLSIVHEFLEFVSLKNTLFVYMAESREGKEYKYDGKKVLNDKLNISKHDNIKEPVLITLIKRAMKSAKDNFNQNDNSNFRKTNKFGDNIFKDEQNSTYIVHEDSQSSTTSNSQSDTSSDEKNKLHLRLHLENSDTDTSSDSTRDKSSSEYIPNEHEMANIQHGADNIEVKIQQKYESLNLKSEFNAHEGGEKEPHLLQELKTTNNSSSDSTSYIDIKPLSLLDRKLLNTTGVPLTQISDQTDGSENSNTNVQKEIQKPQSTNSSTSSIASQSLSKKEIYKNITEREKMSMESVKSDLETAEYSYDFSSPQQSRSKDHSDKQKSPVTNMSTKSNPEANSPQESPHQDSQSSQSSISISDVADLISEKSTSFAIPTNHEKSKGDNSLQAYSTTNSKKKTESNHSKLLSEDSGDFTDSPIPSLSNLSLDIHSD